MYFVYLLRSVKDDGWYIGFTDDIERRFQEHQRGGVSATKYRQPLQLYYYEAYATKEQARERERKLKDFGSAYQGLMKRLGA